MERLTVHQMVDQVLAAAQDRYLQKQAAAEGGSAAPTEPQMEPAKEKQASDEDFMKVADACDFLADHLHEVIDDRTPQEKVAEVLALQENLKLAEDIPVNPPLDSGVNPGGGGSAMKAEETDTPGESLDAGESGQSTPSNQPPKTTGPGEKAYPADSPTALPTNKDMMKEEQPENILKQGGIPAGAQDEFEANKKKALAAQTPAPGAEMVSKKAAAEILDKLSAKGHVSKEAADQAKAEYLKVAAESMPPAFANVLLGQFKTAEDALNPASISAGTKPVLQSAKGANPAQMQGTEVGEQTPRETAPTDYQGKGRDLISSNEAAINYTKGQAKNPQKKPLSELLTEPAMSAAHDKVLTKSLDSTSEAGVKISSLREMLKKVAASSPEAKAAVDQLIKEAMGEAPPAGGSPMTEGAAPGEAAGGEAEALGEAVKPEVSDEAIAAAAEGVTTDELAKAQVLLATQAAEAEATAPVEGAPEGAGEAVPQAAEPAPEAAPAQA